MNILVNFFGRHRSRRVAEFAHHTLEHALDRFASRIREVRVRIRDENAARGGEDHRCSLALQLVDGQQLHVHELAATPESALHRLAQKANRLLRRRGRARRQARRR